MASTRRSEDLEAQVEDLRRKVEGLAEAVRALESDRPGDAAHVAGLGHNLINWAAAVSSFQHIAEVAAKRLEREPADRRAMQLAEKLRSEVHVARDLARGMLEVYGQLEGRLEDVAKG